MLPQSVQDNLEKIRKSVLVFDIETSSFYPDGKEVPIKTAFDDYVKYAKVKFFGCYSYKYNQGYYLNAQTETNEILKLLKEHDVVVGFNIEEFDFPILTNNGFTDDMKRYNIVDVMAILGTSNQRNKKGYAFKNRAALMDVKLKNNHLRGMAESFELETQKGNIDWRIFQKDEWTDEEVIEIKKYLYADVMATKELFERLWNYWMPFAELVPEKSIYDLSWVKSSIASLTYKAACNVLDTEPTYSEKPGVSEEMGGNVYEPKYEELNNVWYVDFGSLYPHIMVMANIPAEVDMERIPSDAKLWHGNDVFQVKGHYDISKFHPLSEYVAAKLKQRIHLKETDKENPMIYTLKILLNGLYGVMRSPIFEKVHTPNAGWDICWLGQQVQQLLKEMLEQFGFEVVMGDTDSVTKDTPIVVKYENQVQIIPIEDLFQSPNTSTKSKIDISKKNILVWTDKGWSKIKYIYRHKTRKEIFRILTRKGFVEVSADHSLVINNKSITPKNLKIGDKIELIPTSLPQLYDIDKDLCWLLGFWLAEGTTGRYVYKDSIKYSWALNQKENKLLEKSKQILLKYGLNTIILDTLKSSNCNKLVPANHNTKVFYELFKEWCLTKSGDKKVPTFILNANLESKKAFIDGYLEGDGSLELGKIISFCSIDKSLFSGICQIWTDLGYEYSLRTRTDKPNVITARILRDVENHSTHEPNTIKKIESYINTDNIYDIETENHHFCGGIGNVNLHNSCFFIAKEGTPNTKEYVLECLGQITDIIKDSFPFPVDTFKINIEHKLEYLMVPFEEQTIEDENGKNKKENGKLVYERRGKKKNYAYIYINSKGEKEIVLVGLPIKKDNATQLSIKIYEEVLKPEILKNMRAKFPASFIELTISDYLKKPEIIQLLSQEYKVNAFSSYKTNCIQAQISQAYFSGQEGVIRLVKNSKVGKCGKGMLYATVEEATNAKLTREDFDLSKVEQELSPFIEYKEEFEVRHIETGVEATVGKDEFKALESVLEVIEEPKKKRGRPKKVITP